MAAMRRKPGVQGGRSELPSRVERGHCRLPAYYACDLKAVIGDDTHAGYFSGAAGRSKGSRVGSTD
jgi:hypothetical protein